MATGGMISNIKFLNLMKGKHATCKNQLTSARN